MRRPLCGAALILLLICLALPPSLWMHTDIREGTASFTGTVGRREQKDGMQVYYLKDTSISGARWILVYHKDSNSQYFIGNTLNVYGTITKYEKTGNPGQFDSLVYYQTRKIDAMCFPDEIQVIDGEVNEFREGLYGLRTCLSRELDKRLDAGDAGVLKAMLLGDRQDMPEEVKKLYQVSGISHLLSISGLHISILGMGLYRGLRRTGLPFAAAGIPAVLLMSSYGMMIGAGASTLRALTMFFLAVGADVLGRTYDIRTGLAAAAVWLLLEQPLYARDGGFLLSFGALMGLTEVVPLIKWLTGMKRVGSGLCTSVSIQVVTLPILMRYFYEIPVYAPFLNLLAVPLMPVLLVLGIVCMILGRMSAWSLMPLWGSSMCGVISQLTAWGCQEILRLVEWTAKLSSRLPGTTFVSGAPENWQMAVYYFGMAGILVIWWMKRERGKRKNPGDEEEKPGWRLRLGFGAVYGICLLFLLVRWEPEFTMTMLDVGQGDGIYFKVRGGNTFLMDGGSTSEEQVGRYRLTPFLKYQGEKRVDYLLVSHGDEDHISGIREILEEDLLGVGCLILPISGREEEACLNLANLALEQETEVLWMKAGDCLQAGKLMLRCLGPQAGQVYETKNAGSMVISLEYERLRILLTGDLEEKGERDVLTEGLLEETYDILKVAHHGSKYSTGEAWLSVVKPSVSLISCGEANSYGHPHEELLERLTHAGSRTYLTPLHGAITVTSDGVRYKIRSYLSE